MEPGRAAMLSMKINNTPKPTTNSTTSTTMTIVQQAPSPPSTLKWEKGKVSKMLNEAEESLMLVLEYLFICFFISFFIYLLII